MASPQLSRGAISSDAKDKLDSESILETRQTGMQILLSEIQLYSDSFNNYSSLIVLGLITLSILVELSIWAISLQLTNNSKFFSSKQLPLLIWSSVGYSLCLHFLILLRVLTAKESYNKCRLARALRFFSMQIIAILGLSGEYLFNTLKFFLATYISFNGKQEDFAHSVFSLNGYLTILWIDFLFFQFFCAFKLQLTRPMSPRSLKPLGRFPSSFELLLVYLMPVRTWVSMARGYAANLGMDELKIAFDCANLLVWMVLLIYHSRKMTFHKKSTNKFFFLIILMQILILIARIGMGRPGWNRALLIVMIGGLALIRSVIYWPMPWTTERVLFSLGDKDNAFTDEARLLVFAMNLPKCRSPDLIEDSLFKKTTGIINLHKNDQPPEPEERPSVSSSQARRAPPQKPPTQKESQTVDALPVQTPRESIFDKVHKTQVQKNKHSTSNFEASHTPRLYEEMAWRVLIYVEEQSPKSVYPNYLQIQWLMTHKPSLSLVLATLHKMTSKTNSLWSKVLLQSVRRDLEAAFRQRYFKEVHFIKGWIDVSIESNRGDSYGEFSRSLEFTVRNGKFPKKVICEVKSSSLDLAFVFFFKSKVETLVNSINQFALRSNNILDMITNKTNNIDKFLLEVETQSTNDTKIRTFFDDFTKLCVLNETIHYIPFIYHLNFNTNRYESALRQLRIMSQKVLRTQTNLFSNQLQLQNENLFSGAFFVLVDSSTKNLGKIIDIYGSYHLFVESFTEVVGHDLETFLTKTVAYYHSSAIEKLHNGAVDAYPVIGGNYHGFIKLPGKNFVAISTVTVRIVPLAECNFAYIVGVIPNLASQDDCFYALIAENMTLEALSYNFLKFIPEEYLSCGRSIREHSSVTHSNLNSLKEKVMSKFIKSEFEHIMSNKVGLEGRRGSRAHSISSASNVVESSLRKNKIEADSSIDIRKLSNFEDSFRFFDNVTKKIITRTFTVSIHHKDFLMSGDGYWYLKLVPKEGNKQLPEDPSFIDSEEEINEYSPPKIETMPMQSRQTITDNQEKNTFTENQGKNTFTENQEKQKITENFEKINLLEERVDSNKNLVRESRSFNGLISLSSNRVQREFDTVNSSIRKAQVVDRYPSLVVTQPEPYDMPSIEQAIKDPPISNNTDIIPFDSSSINKVVVRAPNDEVKEMGMYNKKPASFNSSYTNRAVRSIDSKKRKTLAHQAQLLSKRLDTIREENSPIRYQRLATYTREESKSKLNFEDQDEPISQQNSAYLPRQKRFERNNIYFKYERAVDKPVTSRTVMYPSIELVLGLTCLIVLTVLFQVESQEKGSLFEQYSELYESQEVVKCYLSLSYMQILKSIAINQGVYQNDRLKDVYAKIGTTSDKFSNMLDYSSYMRSRLDEVRQDLYKISVQFYKNLEENDDTSTKLMDTHTSFKRFIAPAKTLNQKLNFFNGIYLNMYKALQDILQKPIDFFTYDFNKTQNYDLVMNNFMTFIVPATDDVDHLIEHLYFDIISEYFVKIILYSSTSGIPTFISLMVIIITWILTVQKYATICHSIFMCQEDEIKEKLGSIARVIAICARYKETNYCYERMLPSQLIEPQMNEGRGFSKIKIAHRRKLSCFRLAWNFLAIICCLLIILGLTVANTIQYSKNSRNLKMFSSRLVAVCEAASLVAVAPITLLEYFLLSRGEAEEIVEYLEEEREEIYEVNRAFSDRSFFNLKNIDSFFLNILDSNNCEKVSDLEDDLSICSKLDSGVASQGYIQMLTRILTEIQRMESLITNINTPGSQTTTLQVLNDKEYIEFEFMVENVYVKVYEELVEYVERRSSYFADKELLSVNNMIITTIYIICAIHILVFTYNMTRINTIRIKRSFVFHLIPVKSVLENQSIRDTFVSVFKLQRLHFG